MAYSNRNLSINETKMMIMCVDEMTMRKIGDGQRTFPSSLVSQIEMVSRHGFNLNFLILVILMILLKYYFKFKKNNVQLPSSGKENIKPSPKASMCCFKCVDPLIASR